MRFQPTFAGQAFGSPIDLDEAPRSGENIEIDGHPWSIVHVMRGDVADDQPRVIAIRPASKLLKMENK